MVEIIEKKWTEEELLDKIAKLENRKGIMKKLGQNTSDIDTRIDAFEKRFLKVKK